LTGSLPAVIIRKFRCIANDLSIASNKEHTMAGIYSTRETTQTPQAVEIPTGKARPALWLVVVISSVINVVTSVTVGSVLISNAFGLIALAGIAALISDHYRNRRR
jgi:hypothetical protein